MRVAWWEQLTELPGKFGSPLLIQIYKDFGRNAVIVVELFLFFKK